VGTVVNDTIHVEVETVELGYSVLCNELGDGGISLGKPSEKLGDTHVERQWTVSSPRKGSKNAESDLK
jgi:hypothetical protein